MMFYNHAIKKYEKRINDGINTAELLRDDCIGSIAEIYDAEEPRMPKGAFAQAWSVAMAIDNIF